ncbi:hypothetical protein BJX65DRAFT_313988 [Aspergillus insuetus]
MPTDAQQHIDDAQAQAVNSQRGTIRYPAVVSFVNTNEGAIMHTYATLLKWRYQKEIHDAVSGMDHEVTFLNIANGAVIATIRFTIPDDKIAQCFRPKEGSDIAVTFVPDRSAEPSEHCTGPDGGQRVQSADH